MPSPATQADRLSAALAGRYRIERELRRGTEGEGEIQVTLNRKPFMRIRFAALVAAGLVSSSAGAQVPDARATVIAIADSALAAITRGDPVALTDLMDPEAVMYPTSTRDGVTSYRARTREGQRTASISGVIERGFKPTAMVNGGVAMVWYPYDLYRNGAWSHCGADVFTLVKNGNTWRIASMAWSAEQPPVCEKHPSEPPAKP